MLADLYLPDWNDPVDCFEFLLDLPVVTVYVLYVLRSLMSEAMQIAVTALLAMVEE